MILTEIKFGELAKCYFPNKIQSEAAKKLLSFLKKGVPNIYELVKDKVKPNGILDADAKLSYQDIAIIGMNIGYPRENMSENVRDTITWGYNEIYNMNDPKDRTFIGQSFRKLDSRLDPPLEIFDA